MSFAAIFSRRGKKAEEERKRQQAIQEEQERTRQETTAADDDAILSKALLDIEKPNYGAVKSRQYGQAIDFVLCDDMGSLRSMLKAYDAIYWMFTNQGRYPGRAFSMAYQAVKFMQKPLPNPGERIPREKILEISCIDWCVAHAFGASGDHIGKVSTYINNQILVSALLMSVTAPLFISPPSFDNEWFQIITSAGNMTDTSLCPRALDQYPCNAHYQQHTLSTYFPTHSLTNRLTSLPTHFNDNTQSWAWLHFFSCLI